MKTNTSTKPITGWRLWWHSYASLAVEAPLFALKCQSQKQISTTEVYNALLRFDERFANFGWKLKRTPLKDNGIRIVWEVIEHNRIMCLISAERIEEY
jgi:hypothetical protein